MSNVHINSGMAVRGSVIFLDSVASFPENPDIGTLVVKDEVLYGYFTIGGLETWYPFSTGRNSYIHTQSISSDTWTVTHNLNSTNLFVQVFDASGDFIAAGKADINANSFVLTFAGNQTGKALVVAPENVDAASVKASIIEIGGGYVTIDSSGVYIDGIAAATVGDVDLVQDQVDTINTTAAFLANAQTFTSPQRGEVTVETDLSIDLSASNNFACTVSSPGTLTFTEIANADGQGGYILLTNSGNHAISAAATTKVQPLTLATISSSGTYLISYFVRSGNVYLVNSQAFV